VAVDPKKKKSNTVKLADLAFYFDAVERDRLDASGTSRKTGEVLALRDKLLKLPEEEFDATLKTVKGLIAEAKPSEDADAARAKQKAQARTLFDAGKAGAGGGAGRTSKVSPA
jgi:hypothetical protein